MQPENTEENKTSMSLKGKEPNRGHSQLLNIKWNGDYDKLTF